MLSLIFGLALVFIAYQSALVQVGFTAASSSSFEQFIQNMFRTVYIICLVTFGSWLFFGTMASYFISFAFSFFLTMCFIDYEKTYEIMQDIDNE